MVGIGYQLIQSAVIGFRPGTMDRSLMELNRAFFLGNDPVLLIEGVTFPLPTDWFAFAYSLNFFIPASVALILHFLDRRSDYRA